VIFLNTWLLKAHVESPLAGSIILAAIVLKLSLYGFLRLVLPLLPVSTMLFVPIVFVICVITIIYASLSTLRTIDVKEIIAYSSVAHAAVYVLGVFSNTIQGIEGAILLGLGHGFVSSGLFFCVGGVLYDRTHTRLITYYRGVASIMPLFSLLFFILGLANAGTPLTFNFVGEFLSLYGAFERLPLLGALACSSIVLSAAFTIYVFNRISFGGSLSAYLATNIPDLNKREFVILLALVIPTVLFGLYPAPILDGLHYSVSTLIYSANEVDFQPLSAMAAFWGGIALKNKSVPTDLDPELEDLDPEFVTGLVDSEGCFELNIVKDNSGPKPKTYFSLCFSMGLHTRDKMLLVRLQRYFKGVGSITKTQKNMVRFRIASRKDLALVIAHFDKYPLITQKQADYFLFRAAYDIICRGAHLTETGFVSIRPPPFKSFT
jgi:NADH-ubiquinone oxidoreductase chain 4